jgi:hypothetical protein
MIVMKARRIVWLGVVGLVFVAGAGALVRCAGHVPKALARLEPQGSYRTASSLDVAETVYDSKLGDGWDDWGWGTHEIKPGAPARIGFSDYAGIILHHAELPSRFGGVSFRYKTTADYGDFLEVSLQYRQVDEEVLPLVPVARRHVALQADGWKEVLIPWSELNPTGSPFDRIQIHARRPVPAELVSIDHIVLTRGVPGVVQASTASQVASRSVRVSIECNRGATPISPLIYGIASTDFDTGATARRMGGNPMTRLNWDLGNAYNTGNDWYFENVALKTPLTAWIEEDLAHGVPSALVVPMIGWVAKDTTSVGFPVKKFGPQQNHDPYRPEAGNGNGVGGKPITPGPPTETSVEASPEVVRRWIETLREHDRARGKRGVDMYILDNEPGIWNTTHRDVHPEPLTYDELIDRTIQYGTAIRKADPDAVIAGPAEWGWTGYFYSAKDVATNHADQRAHGGTPLLPWYLSKLAAYEKATGVRVLDVVDVHFYPQAPHIYGGDGGTDPATSALRLRSTRAFWDPTYLDESWINDHVGLIPRLKGWIADNYPGRGISIGEWSFGAEAHMSGGLAIAETLGRFGQQGIKSAFYWYDLKTGTPAFNAFRVFRNYDGKGAHFLDRSIPTRDGGGVSVFASRDEAGTHLTAVLLNLDPESSVRADVDMLDCGHVSTRRAFVYGPGDAAIAEDTSKPTGAGVSETLRPYSMKVIELGLAK